MYLTAVSDHYFGRSVLGLPSSVLGLPNSEITIGRTSDGPPVAKVAYFDSF